MAAYRSLVAMVCLSMVFIASLGLALLINQEDDGGHDRQPAASTGHDETTNETTAVRVLIHATAIAEAPEEPAPPPVVPIGVPAQPSPPVELPEEPEDDDAWKPIELPPIVAPPVAAPPEDLGQHTHPDPPENEPPTEEQLNEDYPDVPVAIEQLALDLGLTAVAKQELYANNPEIDYTGNSSPCQPSSANSVVLGCWTNDKIYVRQANDYLMKTSLAHELLHAFYYHLYLSGESELINNYIDIVRETHPDKVQAILAIYAGQHSDPEVQEWIEYNELHSFIGTEFRDIPPELEEYYARYFEDRHHIISFYDEFIEDRENRRAAHSQAVEEAQQQLVWHAACLNLHPTSYCDSYELDDGRLDEFSTCLEDIFFRSLSECLDIKPVPVRFSA